MPATKKHAEHATAVAMVIAVVAALIIILNEFPRTGQNTAENNAVVGSAAYAQLATHRYVNYNYKERMITFSELHVGRPDAVRHAVRVRIDNNNVGAIIYKNQRHIIRVYPESRGPAIGVDTDGDAHVDLRVESSQLFRLR